MRKIKHGHTYVKTSKTYICWAGMLSRCKYKSHASYKNYGGRGIKVCKEWNDSFLSFLNDMGEKPLNKSIERIDCNGDYCKENCKWATKEEQCSNTRRSHMITYQGKTQTLKRWSIETGIHFRTLHNRIKRGGRTIEQCLTDKIGTYSHKKI